MRRSLSTSAIKTHALRGLRSSGAAAQEARELSACPVNDKREHQQCIRHVTVRTNKSDICTPRGGEGKKLPVSESRGLKSSARCHRDVITTREKAQLWQSPSITSHQGTHGRHDKHLP
ncbi:hypothetical protein E2C01_023354 [Portunus trituberculatus]|uniref:Uncharacterized protein n=1 Tax=Portunus trituberculatus TaxID=210409 RepID=A0A5B7E8L3_PORTR|nr:hypothetical protein [Portunus trituberculatus]